MSLDGTRESSKLTSKVYFFCLHLGPFKYEGKGQLVPTNFGLRYE